MNFEVGIMLIVIYFMLYCSILFLVIFSSKKKELRVDPKPTRYPLVSIIVPAWNEEKSIKKTIISCLALEYPKKEIIIVNDGSTDRTEEIARRFEEEGMLKVISKENGGKASAMNAGIKIAKGEYVCCMDADSFFNPATLKTMVGYMEDPEVGAVTTSMKVHKPEGFVQMIQWMEYLFAIYLRKLMTYLNCLYVVPGPGGLYRRSLLKKLGGFDEHNITEDMEIAFRIQKAGYQIRNSLDAEVETIAPNTIKGLVKQRVRWYVGFYDNILKYKSMIFNPKYGALGMFMIPTSILWVFLLMYSMMKLSMSFFNSMSMAVRTIWLVGINRNLIAETFRNIFVFNPNYITAFSVILTFVGVLVIYLSVTTSKERFDLRNKAHHYLIYMVGYSFVMTLCWICSFAFIFIRGKERGWKGGKI
ncbi:MAG TPA: glycosyltransferase [Candidatus Woesearchaeota archaeon]|nr:glycosyltransferase [Candidatus Woesearchaeota archaeon]